MSLLFEASIRAGLIAAAIAAIVYVLRIVNAPARHTAWCGVLFAMLLLPVFSAWGPKATIPVLPAIEFRPIAVEPALDTAPAALTAVKATAQVAPVESYPNCTKGPC